MKLRYKILLVLVVLGITFGLGRCKRTETSGSKPSVPAVLPPSDIEQISVDPETHKLIILTSKGTQTVTLPDRTSTIDVLKNGTVKVSSKQFGFEHHPFVGLQGSDHLRIAIGVDGWYFKKLDIGIGIADRVGAYTPIIYTQVSYNVWSNCRIGLSYGTDRYIGGTFTVRL